MKRPLKTPDPGLVAEQISRTLSEIGMFSNKRQTHSTNDSIRGLIAAHVRELDQVRSWIDTRCDPTQAMHASMLRQSFAAARAVADIIEESADADDAAIELRLDLALNSVEDLLK